ncbi:hypothetical protein BatF92_42190 [Bacteroides thetaiotaomicron]|uniref:Uncharacterized protein n=1 Tax=Bacteroides thetaiotaomicron TaxID=818 RepID=A0A679HPV4_BACT4|nr:hypothetical protein BatF92_42190 [Bacteroides thetaiotaomicron]
MNIINETINVNGLITVISTLSDVSFLINIYIFKTIIHIVILSNLKLNSDSLTTKIANKNHIII